MFRSPWAYITLSIALISVIVIFVSMVLKLRDRLSSLEIRAKVIGLSIRVEMEPSTPPDDPSPKV